MLKSRGPAALEHAAHHAPEEELAYHAEFAEEYHVFRVFPRCIEFHLRTVHIHTERMRQGDQLFTTGIIRSQTIYRTAVAVVENRRLPVVTAPPTGFQS